MCRQLCELKVLGDMLFLFDAAITAIGILHVHVYSVAIELIPILFDYMPSENTFVLCFFFV